MEDNAPAEALRQRKDTTLSETFVKIIYVRLYGQRKAMGYRVETEDVVNYAGYRFRDYWVIKK